MGVSMGLDHQKLLERIRTSADPHVVGFECARLLEWSLRKVIMLVEDGSVREKIVSVEKRVGKRVENMMGGQLIALIRETKLLGHLCDTCQGFAVANISPQNIKAFESELSQLVDRRNDVFHANADFNPLDAEQLISLNRKIAQIFGFYDPKDLSEPKKDLSPPKKRSVV